MGKLAPLPQTKWSRIWHTFKRERSIWLICVPIILWVIVFRYYPMYGVLMSFVNFRPGKSIMDSTFVGLRWFSEFFADKAFPRTIRNTLVISGFGILTGLPAPIILAVLLKELRNKAFKKTVQTISYLPHFISWVVAASILYSFLSSDGLLNDMLINLGLREKGINYLGEGKYFWAIITLINLWKGVGWSSIIYLSAIEGVDSELYQAGAVDGLNRFGMIWHITLPGIRSTIILLWIMGLAGILDAGFEQQLLIGNDATREYWDVIDTYVYRYGIQMGRYSYGTAVGTLKSAIGLLLFLGANKISKKLFDLSIL